MSNTHPHWLLICLKSRSLLFFRLEFWHNLHVGIFKHFTVNFWKKRQDLPFLTTFCSIRVGGDISWIKHKKSFLKCCQVQSNVFCVYDDNRCFWSRIYEISPFLKILSFSTSSAIFYQIRQDSIFCSLLFRSKCFVDQRETFLNFRQEYVLFLKSKFSFIHSHFLV